MIRFTIDRIEEGLAVCETEAGRRFHLPTDLFEGEAAEGRSFTLARDPAAEEDRRRRIGSLLEELLGEDRDF